VTAAGEACAEVLLDLPARRAERRLTYRVPEALRPMIDVGTRVLVPLGPRQARGFVLGFQPCDQPGTRELREIQAIVDPRPCFSERMLELARWVADTTLATVLEAVHCLIPPDVLRRRDAARARSSAQDAARERGEREDVSAAPPQGAFPAIGVPTGQGAVPGAEAPTHLEPSIPTLLWGGADARREWILQATMTEIGRGGRALIIVPEIALIPDLRDRARALLGDRVVDLHSGMTGRARRVAWGRIVDREAGVVIGTRSALFAPLDRLRLIVLDEEQDTAYKADASPRYHGRDVALHRGMLERARVVLGSPAPSVETYAAIAAGQFECIRLPRAAAPPRVTLVDMRAERSRGARGLLSQPLLAAIRRHLRSGGRVALFVNRVGYARILFCQECGRAVRCRRCEVTMPYDGERRAIFCRICGRTNPAPEVCPGCGGAALRWIGAGTERVEEVIGRLFPAIRIARVDRETEREFAGIAGDFASGRTRIVVGTQLMLRARQLRPTLIGVVDADLPLYLPDFRAGERTLQQLRAVLSLADGGQADGGPAAEAVVQTRVPEHPAIAALRTGDDETMYRGELAVRRQFGYPPYTALASLIAAGPDRQAAQRLAAEAVDIVQRFGVEVLGPAPARDPGPRGGFRYHCLLRAADGDAVRAAGRAALTAAARGRRGRLTVEMDPQEIH